MKKALSLMLTMCMVLSLFATFVISASAEEAVNLAAGKTYTVSETGGNYSDDGVKLTDGSRADNVWAGSWAGFTPNTPSQAELGYAYINVDLGVVADVTKVVLHLGIDDGSGIAIPYNVAIAASEDGSTYTVVKEFVPEADKTYGAQDRSTDVEVTTRYIQFRIESYGWAFVDEVEVWGTEAKAEVPVLEWKPMFVSHFDNTTVEGAGVIFTDNAKNTNYAWRIHAVFAPIAGVENGYEVVDIINYLEASADKVTKTPVIPEGGFAYNLNYGNDYPSLNMDGPDYTSPNCNNMIADALTWKVGDKFVFEGLDLEGKTVPTSTPDTNWYDDAYVCTAKYAAYVPGANQGTVVITKGDNIALNKTYTISGCGERTSYYAKLTDGVAKAELSYNNDEWFGFYCNGEDQSIINAPDKLGYVIIDLGAAYDIYGVSINFMDLAGDSGIYAPTAVNAYLSADGETWGDAVALTIPAETTKGVSYAVEGEVSGNARYVKVDVALGGTFAFLNEIEVYEAKKTVVSGVIKEVIAVDGDVNDTGWAKKGWINVSGENGFWQYPTPKEIAAGAVIPTFTYKHQFRADDTKLYGAVVLDGVHEEDKNIKVRVWFRNNDEATVYSSFYDFVLAPDGTLETAAKYNTSTTENKGAAIEPTTLEAVAKVVDGKTVFEFSVNVDEVTKDGNFDYFVSLERKQGVNTGTLYYPFVPELNETSPHGNYPWLLWYAENDATVEVKDIVLGEIVVSDKEEADTSMMGTAPADPAFTVTLATEDGWKAGEKLVVTATVDVLKDGVDLSQILFNLYYDAADVEIVLPEELGAIITAGAESWKEDSLFTLSVDGDYGVIECAPATTVEADVLKKGTQLVMTFEFTVKADAEGLINFQLSNKGLTGYSWDLDAAEVAGAGSSLAVGNADELGDTGIYVIAALALVALIGTAIVIKKRA